ncbi:hypothetical protein [Constantimarinum furrinae]|uniref:Glycine dehydrogenase n=1 Tax=Constantimarinum furrinae TaxID=2562285 RepID=A0A7G8PUJ1_9FLAO|nr:hypothetical protein [Constantimarinum furrinae]QNJ98007.1 glycine dehydrogenase [Constantimarinum furrinae]
MKIMINCGEAAQVCDKAQYEEASRWQKLLMKIHQFMCRLCREHSIRNGKLSSAIKSADLKTLPKENKEAIKKRLQQELSQ